MKKTLFLTAILGGFVATQARADWNDDKTVYTYDDAAVTAGTTLADIAAGATAGTAYTVTVTAADVTLAVPADMADATIQQAEGSDALTLKLTADGNVGSSTLKLQSANSNTTSQIEFGLADGATTATYTLGEIWAGRSNGSARGNITIDENVNVAATTMKDTWGMTALTVNGTLTTTDFTLTGDGYSTSIAGTGTISTTNLTSQNYGGPYNFTVANVTVSDTFKIIQNTKVTMNGTNLSIAKAIQNSSTLQFTGDSTIDIAAAMTAGTITETVLDTVAASDTVDGFGVDEMGYVLVTGNAATIDDGVTVTIKNGDTTLSSDTNVFNGKTLSSGNTQASTTRYFLVANDSYTTSEVKAAAASSTATQLSIASGKTLTVDDASYGLDAIYGAGNVTIATATTMSGSKSSQSTGTLTVQGVKLTIGNGDSEANSLSSFSAVKLTDGSTIQYSNSGDTLNNVSVDAGATAAIFSDDMGASGSYKLTLAGTTNVAGTLNITHNWNAQFSVAALSGDGTVNLGSGAQESSSFALSNLSAFSGTLNIGNSQATVTISGPIGATTINKTAGTLNINGYVVTGATINSDFNITGNTRFDFRGNTTINGNITNNTTRTADKYLFIVGDGTNTCTTTVNGTADLTNSGTITNCQVGIGKNATLVIGENGSMTTNGVKNSGTRANNGSLTVKSGATFTTTDSSVGLNVNDLTNEGTMSIAGGIMLNGALTTKGSMTFSGSTLNMAANKAASVIGANGSLSIDGMIYTAIDTTSETGATITRTTDGTMSLFADNTTTTVANAVITTESEKAISANLDNVSLVNTTNTNSLSLYGEADGAVKNIKDVNIQGVFYVGAGSYGNGNATDVTVTGTLTAGGVTVGSNASITLADADATVNNLTLQGGSITLGTEGSHENDLTTESLTVSGTGSTINADLVMTTGTLTFSGSATLNMGCDVTISDDVKVFLDKSVIDATDPNTFINLVTITDKDNSTIDVGDNTVFVYYMDGTTEVKTDRTLAYNATTGVIYATPEPATATLSLLALAGLCARRRRK